MLSLTAFQNNIKLKQLSFGLKRSSPKINGLTAGLAAPLAHQDTLMLRFGSRSGFDNSGSSGEGFLSGGDDEPIYEDPLMNTGMMAYASAKFAQALPSLEAVVRQFDQKTAAQTPISEDVVDNIQDVYRSLIHIYLNERHAVGMESPDQVRKSLNRALQLLERRFSALEKQTDVEPGELSQCHFQYGMAFLQQSDLGQPEAARLNLLQRAEREFMIALKHERTARLALEPEPTLQIDILFHLGMAQTALGYPEEAKLRVVQAKALLEKETPHTPAQVASVNERMEFINGSLQHIEADITARQKAAEKKGEAFPAEDILRRIHIRSKTN
ncbi:MAG: hypothetical protein K2X01_08935 [Cyanobacteria bacterium]|nr:hypothetical protein [Cyanobacteriota bacterium]